MFKQRAVFPADGRAARMISSEFCSPAVFSSRSMNQVGRVAPVVEDGDGLVDFLVSVGVEVVFAEDLQDVADDAVVAEHAAQDAAFRLTALRRQTVDPSLVRHGSPLERMKDEG